jgi:hypothetical protein
VKCLVCPASWPDDAGSVCPQCKYDQSAEGAREPAALNRARAAFRDKTTAYAPDTRVSAWDKWRPWAAVGVGFFIFVYWLRACATGGFL